MKRVVEEVSTIDRQVGSLYEEGAKKEMGSGNVELYERGAPLSLYGISGEGRSSLLSLLSEGSRHTYQYSLTQGRGYPYTSRYWQINVIVN